MDEKKTSLVEKITLTSVPADQRKSWPSIAFIWAGSVICIPALLVGSLISAGMNFKQSALCMVIGYVLVVFYMCLMGIQSSDLGLPATVAISRAYGKRGSSFLVSLVIQPVCQLLLQHYERLLPCKLPPMAVCHHLGLPDVHYLRLRREAH
mgnify:CR=1 FL=1